MVTEQMKLTHLASLKLEEVEEVGHCREEDGATDANGLGQLSLFFLRNEQD